MKGLWGWSISLYRGSVEGASGGAPSLWTLDDMLRKSPVKGISLHGGPLSVRGDPGMWVGSRMPGTLIDE